MDVHGWLRSEVSNPGAFVVYPPEYDVSKAVGVITRALLQSGTAEVLFMVENPEEVIKAIGMNVPREIFVPYRETPLLDRMIQRDVWVIVDSIRLFQRLQIGDIAQRAGRGCRFLIFGTVGFTDPDLVYLNESLPGIWSLYTSFIDHRLKVDLSLISVSEVDPSSGLAGQNPKLQRLVTNISVNRDKRQVVYTRDGSRNGLDDILTTMVTRMGIPVIVVPENTWNVKQKLEIENFNQASSGVYVTSSIPPIGIENIEMVHIVDEFDEDIYKGLMDRIFRVDLLPSRSVVKVYFYIDETTPEDLSEYRSLVQTINAGVKLYDEVVMGSIPILFDLSAGKIVLGEE